MPERILIIDDEPSITEAFASLLQDEGYRTETSASIKEALAKCNQYNFSLALLDLNFPAGSGLDFLRQIKDEPEPPLVLVISGQSDIPTAIEAVKLGAIDYLEKPVPPEKLISSVRAAIMLAIANRQRSLLVNELDSQSQIIGSSKALKKHLKAVTDIASSDSTVLITGENGTGKELVATRLFLESNRRDKPFVKVNCPGIPSNLFESELFGHKKGAFTGAIRDYPGKFVHADGGTLFLDEIGDLPLECQAKLLRVLETKEVETLGAVDKVNTDVRVICATNKNLIEAVSRGEFREDLYYRISVLTIDVPPLSKRLDDIPLLVGEFLKKFDPAGNTALSAEAMAFLTSLDYPGNVRQLKNIIERICIFNHSTTVELNELKGHLTPGQSPASSPQNTTISLSERVKNFERHLIQTIIKECGGNISRAAKLLQVDRANLSKKIKEMKIEKE